MQTIEIYTKPTCSFYHMAKRVLTAKSVSFTKINITTQPEKRAEMIQHAKNGSTVPQIFISGKHVNGCNDLMTLDRQNKLDSLLSA